MLAIKILIYVSINLQQILFNGICLVKSYKFIKMTSEKRETLSEYLKRH